VRRGSVILVDNFKSHTNKASYVTVEKDMSCTLFPLPPNTTSVCQPLDVGIMGPFKSKLRRLWLHEEAKANMTAKEKRRATIDRAIKAWDEISADVVVRSFEKALPHA
jgi:hypothetical protein